MMFNPPAGVRARATVSECGKYRYWLSRLWDAHLPALAVVMLNPSTADGKQDDQTIRKLYKLVRGNVFGGFEVYNLFAYRATDPKHLRSAGFPVGPENDARLREISTINMPLALAWGDLTKFGQEAVNRGHRVLRIMQPKQRQGSLYVFGLTSHGYPRHPLYLRDTTALQPYHSV